MPDRFVRVVVVLTLAVSIVHLVSDRHPKARFQPTDNFPIALDTETGQVCSAIGQKAPNNLVPLCSDLQRDFHLHVGDLANWIWGFGTLGLLGWFLWCTWLKPCRERKIQDPF